jgi:hypothetical protein
MRELKGNRFGRLVAISRVMHNGKYKWNCLCDCGNVTYVYTSNLTTEHTTSCGCLHKEKFRPQTTHNLTKHPLYKRWNDIKYRCYNPNATKYDRYGGRGIEMCQEWLEDFTAFYNWAIENGYSKELTIDRINNDGDYEPSNCQWITNEENVSKMRKLYTVKEVV